jgi:hypothetical protein
MGRRRRQAAADGLTFRWLLDPSFRERRRANQLAEQAAGKWAVDYYNQPGWEHFDSSVKGTPLAGLLNDENYQAGRAAEMDALRQMQGIAAGGGYTDVERGQIRQAQQQAAQHERSQRLAALQQMQQRGMAGGGAELASRLQAQQGGANRAARDATAIATAGQQRALQAMQNTAEIGNRQQKQGMQRANAIDSFNRANAEARSRARQQAITNRQQSLAGLTGQYSHNADNMYNQAQQSAQAAQNVVTSVIGAVAS